ncbi:SDR family oxidoreductase [Streptomyces sp. URMC 129]|uniref:SDR family oxidoreductase n=1 Tax=Streptomyces sp. URMC 129 TaxID=3423407 RepID=UPI003F1DB24E
MTARRADPWRARSVLLTGATGHLGGEVCARLMARTPASVHCLVRAADEAAARDRLSRRLAVVGGGHRPEYPPAGRERLVAIPGDLEHPTLGLSRRGYDVLAETVDTVLHCAASVSLGADPARLEGPNIVATRNLIALGRRRAALTGAPPAFHYVSTLAALAGARTAGLAEVDETVAAVPELAGDVAYARSKAIAETEVRAVADAGLPVTILRPGLVAPHSAGGRPSLTDPLAPLLRAAVAMGAVPDDTGGVPADMVDVVADAIVALMGRADAAGRTFHLARPEPLRLTDVFDALRRAGHRLDTVSTAAWWECVERNADRPEVLPVTAMPEAIGYAAALDRARRLPRYRSDATWAVLAGAGVQAPPMDAAYLDRVVEAVFPGGPARPGRPGTG